MKKYWHILVMLICVSMFSACGDDDDELEVDEEWKEENLAAFEEKSNDEEYTHLTSQTGAGYILYKVLEEGDSDERIYYNSKVSVYYYGTFIDGTVFDDHSFDAGAPYAGSDDEGAYVYSFVDGFCTALQYMHPGDRWEIWIPYQMAYGTSGNDSGDVTILPYTTLIFDLEVVEIMEP